MVCLIERTLSVVQETAFGRSFVWQRDEIYRDSIRRQFSDKRLILTITLDQIPSSQLATMVPSVARPLMVHPFA